MTGRKLAGFNDPEAVIFFLLSSLMESIFFNCFLSLQVDGVLKKETIQQALSPFLLLPALFRK